MVVVAAAGVLAAGCTTPGAGGTGVASATASSASSSAGSSGPVPAGLNKFYSQHLTWSRCGAGETMCTQFEVPIDYAKPDGETVKLKMLKLPARGGSASRGAMFVNPGGPGGSATEYAAAGDWALSAQLRRNFDVVGFDPRGVAQSNPITCVDPRTLDILMGYDPTPDDAAERAELSRLSADFGKACAAKYPQLLGHVSTIEAAKDMDIARAVIGQPKLNYLGKSYGTFLGATYAGLFPTNVGRMVLDGAVPPDLTDDEMNIGQAEGFEAATRAYVADCVRESGCPLGSDLEGGMTKLRDFLARLDTKPLPVRGDASVNQLTEGWGSVALAEAMYDQGMWAQLTPALADAFNGDGTRLFDFARQYARRNSDGTYSSNIMQVISAVNCLDRGAKQMTDAEREARTKAYTAKAPTWGRFMVSGSTICETWPAPPTGQIAKVRAAGSPPIVVVGTTRDPATPYAWSKRLAEQLENGHLITMDGDGHTAYMRANNCVDRAVDNYFMDGTVPKDGLTC